MPWLILTPGYLESKRTLQIVATDFIKITTKFENALDTEPIQILIKQYMERSTEDLNISLENVMKILTETSKLCLKIKAKKTYKRIKNHPTRNGSTVNVA